MVEFNYIRNRIRKYSKESLIMSSLRILRFSEAKNIKNYPIWDILLVIKWSFIHAEQDRYPRIATEKDIQFLVERIEELRSQHDFYIGEHKIDLIKVLSLTLYQQSYFQFSVWQDSFSRQIKLFSDNNMSYNIDQEFLKYSGISIKQFITLSFLLWVYSSPDSLKAKNRYNGVIGTDFIELAHKFANKECIEYFFDLLSIDYLKAAEIINSENQIQNPILQTFEISIFSIHPILLFNDSKIIFHKKLLNYTMNHFIYDYLKVKDNERFSTEFGKRFEKYIELGIKEISVEYKTENQLKMILPNNSKVVDFIIEDNILIECKAIDIKPYPSVFPNDDVIYNWLETSIIKAYSQQMMSTANLINPNEEKFGIILTYKETYFGNGLDAWRAFLKEPTEKYVHEQDLNLNLLPPKNLFFIDIATWDRIIHIIKSGKSSLKEILLKAIRDNEKNESQKFSFHMHIEDIELGPYNLSYLEKIDNIIDFDRFKEA